MDEETKAKAAGFIRRWLYSKTAQERGAGHEEAVALLWQSRGERIEVDGWWYWLDIRPESRDINQREIPLPKQQLVQPVGLPVPAPAPTAPPLVTLPNGGSIDPRCIDVVMVTGAVEMQWGLVRIFTDGVPSIILPFPSYADAQAWAVQFQHDVNGARGHQPKEAEEPDDRA